MQWREDDELSVDLNFELASRVMDVKLCVRRLMIGKSDGVEFDPRVRFSSRPQLECTSTYQYFTLHLQHRTASQSAVQVQDGPAIGG